MDTKYEVHICDKCSGQFKTSMKLQNFKKETKKKISYITMSVVSVAKQRKILQNIIKSRIVTFFYFTALH